MVSKQIRGNPSPVTCHMIQCLTVPHVSSYHAWSLAHWSQANTEHESDLDHD